MVISENDFSTGRTMVYSSKVRLARLLYNPSGKATHFCNTTKHSRRVTDIISRLTQPSTKARKSTSMPDHHQQRKKKKRLVMPARRRGITGHSYTFRPSRARPAGNAWSPAEQLSHSGPGMPNTALGTSDSPRAHEQQERNEHQGHDAQHRSPRSCLARRKKRKQISGYERLGTPHLPLAGVLVGGWAVQECQHSEKTRHATQGRCVGGRRSKRGRKRVSR
ncbi:hypothetical protein EV126DRAFT_221883 [Verticillium dahliae]|nr:hypothetical protein EV126DRAFT_221883 [Verticillium dahliae]